jgi:hypothetical protein
MSFSLAIIVNVILDAAILGGLAFAMSRPRRLRRHEPATVRLFEVPREHAEESEQQRAA